eukprot:TRINITY_DN902_c0_g1_i1.p1 TRINITY_DN902_c0_g1~~TRINITY_DN902_c0_g1_i1.p1  ORF type:complete len:300 (+),score=58.76 TRINITY_DN902_c0_g1_i1:160-1059(+)
MAERQKVILLTGGSDGLGYVAATKFLKLGWRVIITGRQREKNESAVENAKKVAGKEDISHIILDLSNLESIRNAANEFLSLNLPLDVLLNNAGCIASEKKVDPTGTFEMSIFSNFVGPFYFTELLLEKIKSTPNSRILIVTSELHNPAISGPGGRPAILDFDELNGRNFDAFYSYKISKLANIYHTYILAEQLKGQGVTVNCFTPGFVPATSLVRGFNVLVRFASKYILRFLSHARDIETATNEYVYYASSYDLKDVTGGYFAQGQKSESSPASHDVEQGKRLWNLACEVTGLRDRILP